ncbi:hapless 2-like [Helianthus annuus]|uniref:hapless 2-like n=1 Tax=Helianthus annuus TaxID=4232 RepID=UPI00165328F9|nr:hapless 2-like [Helianthus annuus]
MDVIAGGRVQSGGGGGGRDARKGGGGRGRGRGGREYDTTRKRTSFTFIGMTRIELILHNITRNGEIREYTTPVKTMRMALYDAYRFKTSSLFFISLMMDVIVGGRVRGGGGGGRDARKGGGGRGHGRGGRGRGQGAGSPDINLFPEHPYLAFDEGSEEDQRCEKFRHMVIGGHPCVNRKS